MNAEIKELIAPTYNNVGLFGKMFLPEDFSSPYREIHTKIHEALDGPWQKVVIAAPRGLGKTTTVRAKIIERILWREIKFGLYIARSEPLAILQTENIKRALRSNAEIKKIWGDVKIDQDDESFHDETFSKHAWIAFGNTLIMPRGKGQAIRGLIWGNHRWDFAVVDDLEDKLELENPENRRKDKDWFYTDFMRGVDRYSKKWKIIYIDTLKHSESLLSELLNSSDWHSLRLEMFDDNYNSNVPEMYTNEEIRREIETARTNGTLDQLYMELRNIPVSKENASFRSEYFKYYEEKDIAGLNLETFVILDPAKTVQIQNADTAIVAIGVDYISGAIYFRDCVSEKMYPDEIYQEFFDMCRRYKVHTAGVETTGLEEFIKQPLTNYMHKLGPQYFVNIEWLKARGGDPAGEKGKIKRIGALVPYYRQGTFYHNKTCCGKLEAQLLNFPRSGLVDVADALAYIIELLEIGGRYFTSPEREPMYNDDGEAIPYDDDDELEYEAATTGWRIA